MYQLLLVAFLVNLNQINQLDKDSQILSNKLWKLYLQKEPQLRSRRRKNLQPKFDENGLIPL